MTAEAPSRSTFADLRPAAARVVLALYLAVSAWFVVVTLSPKTPHGDADGVVQNSDVLLYRAEVERIRAGEGYYQAAAAELRARGYPSGSVFNWRTPLPMWLIGRLPHPDVAKVLLCGAALTTLLLAGGIMQREAGTVVALGCLLLLIGAFLPCIVGDLFVMPVVWAGTFIALSLCAHGAGRVRLSIITGTAAAWLRELALPYCLLMLVVSAWRGHRREAFGWAIGIGTWAAFFAWHAVQVIAWQTPDDRFHAAGWVQMLGAPFVIATAQMNCFLLVLPQWVTALYLPLAMLGLAGWRGAWGERLGLTVCGYFVGLAIVGQSFNQYWGSLYAPLLCFGAARGPQVLGQLWQACRWSSAARTASA